MKEWIHFLQEPRDPKKKTLTWTVVPNKDNEDGSEASYVELGEVRWYASWRRYCFFPNEGTVFEQDCLRMIAAFCQRETRAHRITSALRKPACG